MKPEDRPGTRAWRAPARVTRVLLQERCMGTVGGGTRCKVPLLPGHATGLCRRCRKHQTLAPK